MTRHEKALCGPFFSGARMDEWMVYSNYLPRFVTPGCCLLPGVWQNGDGDLGDDEDNVDELDQNGYFAEEKRIRGEKCATELEFFLWGKDSCERI